MYCMQFVEKMYKNRRSTFNYIINTINNFLFVCLWDLQQSQLYRFSNKKYMVFL